MIAIGANGPELVAVVSGRAEMSGQLVTVAVVAETLLPGLIAARTAPRVLGLGVKTRRVGEAREGIGALFLRP